MPHGRADGLFIISGTVASTLFLFHLGGSPVTCYFFVDKLISSLPKVAKSSSRSALVLYPAPRFFLVETLPLLFFFVLWLRR